MGVWIYQQYWNLKQTQQQFVSTANQAHWFNAYVYPIIKGTLTPLMPFQN